MNNRKVTIGFKADAALKLELREEAEESEMTVSEYLEAIVETRHVKQDFKMVRIQLREAQDLNDKLLEKLDAYEKVLDNHFNLFKGKELQYRNRDGKIVPRRIITKIDLLECFVSSIKSES